MLLPSVGHLFDHLLWFIFQLCSELMLFGCIRLNLILILVRIDEYFSILIWWRIIFGKECNNFIRNFESNIIFTIQTKIVFSEIKDLSKVGLILLHACVYKHIVVHWQTKCLTIYVHFIFSSNLPLKKSISIQ